MDVSTSTISILQPRRPGSQPSAVADAVCPMQPRVVDGQGEGQTQRSQRLSWLYITALQVNSAEAWASGRDFGGAQCPRMAGVGKTFLGPNLSLKPLTSTNGMSSSS